jgi:prefoldin subunit 5
MNERQNIRNITSKDSIWIDFEKKSNEIKLRALNDSSVGINFLIENEEKKTIEHWDKYVINRKEKKVKTELEKVKAHNEQLQQEVGNLSFELFDLDRKTAHNMGYGDLYEKAIQAADDTFNLTMKKYEKQIEEIKNSFSYPGKTKAEIKVIEDRISKLTVDDMQPLSPMPNTD